MEASKKRKVDDLRNAKPTLLIGVGHIGLTVARDVKEGPAHAPIASKTKLGWIIHGNLDRQSGRNDYSCVVLEDSNEDERLHELVKESYSLDSLGIIEKKDNLKSRQDLRAENLMETHTKRVANRFKTCLLWKHDEPRLPDNRDAAMKRLLSIERKMDRDPGFAEEYCQKVMDYVDKGYARRMTPEEAAKVSPKTWYLPHFFAYHPNKPSKPRFVFDAAAEYRGQSLNNNLVPGPDVLKSLPGILMKFREKRIAFTADIREMFHQVLIREEDQDAQRFLWRGNKRDGPPDTYVMRAMTFGSTCSPYAAQYVKNKNAMEFIDQYPEAVDAIINHHYVDDLADGAENEKEAVKLINEIVYVHAQGGFEIAKWCCSSRRILEMIPEELRGTDMKTLEMKGDLPIERVLGLKWDPNADTFQFATSFNKVDPAIIDGTRIPTKREVLKTVMSVFDPLGFLSNYIIKAKILYQAIWKANVEWDDAIPAELQQIWHGWIKQIPEVAKLAIPRYYFDELGNRPCQLHMFCDASSKAYAAVGYLRYENNEGGISVKMVTARARVAPLKMESIPRLELQSALIAVRLASFINEEQNVKISSVTYWTDARSVVLRLRSDTHRYKSFVAHRLGEILEKSDVRNWRWLPTKMNPADEATRSSPKVKISYESQWFQGPSFLVKPESEWPVEKQIEEIYDEAELELKKEFCAVVDNVPGMDHLPDASRFSNWTRLIRATGWVRRFCKKIKAGGNKTFPPELTVKDIQWAERQWWLRVQQECFPEEVDSLKKKQPIPKGSRLTFLSPFMDSQGVMRVSSRTVRSPEMGQYQREPVILDPDHRYTKLLIMHQHIKALHQGQEYVVNELRQKYWVLKMRTAVKSAWNSCLKCKQRSAKPRQPEIAPLPEFRLKVPVRPFTVCGLDYFGPLTVSKFRRQEKRWGALFTCMHTRAVHLELVDSLSTDALINAMVRMASLRGWPQKFYSDNGTNFRGATTELKKSLADLDQEKLLGRLALEQVEWHFIPPYAAHFGGTWERLVRSVKKALEAILKEQSPKEDTLRTLFAEAANVINSRPLTYVSSDKDDVKVLTPNSFLIGTTSTTPVLGEFEDRDLCLKKQWRAAQRMADHFWRRWVKEYLPTLTRKTKWTKASPPVEVGDIVVIVDDNLPRNAWPKGVIKAVFPGKDGIIRVADVRTIGGTFRRPVTKLCVLEVQKSGSIPPPAGIPGGVCCWETQIGPIGMRGNEKTERNAQPRRQTKDMNTI